jgi:hypothetical protein
MATATSAARRLARWPAVVQWTGSAHWANAADNSAPARTYDEVAATKTMRRTRQIATLCRLEGPQAAGMVGEGQIIVERAPASTGRVALVTEASHYRHFAGSRSDPFFFDRRGMLNNLWFTGEEWIKQP